MSIRYSYNQALPSNGIILSRRLGPHTSVSSLSHTPASQEDSCERDRRIFGGEEGESEVSDLRGPMLDVVLGLFNGVDYDDESC